jgi:hypothetical protein
MNVSPGDNYSLLFQKQGYVEAVYQNINADSGQIKHLEAVMQILITESDKGSIVGKVVNAINGNPVPGVQIVLKTGINTIEGSTVASTQTDRNGRYKIDNLSAGNYTIKADKDSYVAIIATGYCIGGKQSEMPGISLTPVLSRDELRIVLDWGKYPLDLDSHIRGPVENGNSRFHVYFENKKYLGTNSFSVDLDRDDTDSYGPETVTIRKMIQGDYIYAIHDYTNRNSGNTNALSKSSARIRVYQGEELLETFHVPKNTNGTLWKVFEIKNGIIKPVNYVTYNLDF